MKFWRVCFLAVLTFSCGSVSAQFSLWKVRPSSLESKAFSDSIKRNTGYSNEFFSMSRWKAERRALRKERNTIEFNARLQVSQTQFENWAAGGENTFSGRTTVDFSHTYKREKLSISYAFNARYGINVISGKSFKNEDEFKINMSTGWQMHKSWSYAASANLRSQFSSGYASRTDKTLKSSFMAPGFLDISVGFTYNKSPWNINLSPVGGSAVFVLDDRLLDKGMNGVPKGQHSKWQVGPSVRVKFDKEFFKQIFRFRSDLYSFTNIRTPPTMRWESTLDIRATKFLTTTVYALVYYDKYADTPKPQAMQYNYSFSIGLAYTFKNK